MLNYCIVYELNDWPISPRKNLIIENCSFATAT